MSKGFLWVFCSIFYFLEMKYGYIFIVFFKHSFSCNHLCAKHLVRRLSSKPPFSGTHATLTTWVITGALSASLPWCHPASLCTGTGVELRQGAPSLGRLGGEILVQTSCSLECRRYKVETARGSWSAERSELRGEEQILTILLLSRFGIQLFPELLGIYKRNSYYCWGYVNCFWYL